MPRLFYFTSTDITQYRELQDGGSAPASGNVTDAGTGLAGLISPVGYNPLSSGVLSCTSMGATPLPDASPNAAYDSFRTASAITATFSAAAWTLKVALICTDDVAAHTVSPRVRIWRSANSDGSSATEITSGALTDTAQSASTTEMVFNYSFSPGSVTLTAEYLFVQVAFRQHAKDSGYADDGVLCYLREGTNAVLIVPTAGPIEGTAAVTFGAEGGLVASAAIEGTASCSFGASGTLSGFVAVDGTAAVNFGAEGALACLIAGTAPMVFGAEGALACLIAGTAACSFAAEGTIANRDAIAGTAAMHFAAYGELGVVTSHGQLPPQVDVGVCVVLYNHMGQLVCTVERAALQRTLDFLSLQRVERAVLSISGGSLVFTSTRAPTQVMDLPAAVSQTATFTAPIRAIGEILRTVPEGPLELTLDRAPGATTPGTLRVRYSMNQQQAAIDVQTSDIEDVT